MDTLNLVKFVLFFSFNSLVMLRESAFGQAQNPPDSTYSGEANYGIRQNYYSDNPLQNRQDVFIDSLLGKYMKSFQNCGFSIGISLGDSLSYYNYGETIRKSRLLPNKHTFYEVGAITHAFCTYLLSRALVEKRVNLEDDIRKYLPSSCSALNYEGKPILIKHLTAHTSGLPLVPENLEEQEEFDSQDPFKNYTKKLLMEELKTVEIQFSPGSKCQYSGFGMAVLAFILEKTYDRPFNELVSEFILAELKMNTTTFQLDEKQLRNFAQGYDSEGDSVSTWHFGEIPAFGGLKSCTEDLLFFLQTNMKDTELNKRAQKILYMGHEKRSTSWFVKDTKQGNTLFWLNGGTAGYSAFCGFIPELNTSFVLLANSGMNIDFLAIAISDFMQNH